MRSLPTQSNKRSRLTVGWILVALLLLALALTACGGAAAPAEEEPAEEEPAAEAEEEAAEEPEPEEEMEEEEAPAEEEPMEPQTVRIGVLNPTTGGLAIFGEQENTGIKLYFDNSEIENVEVELVFADTAGDPQQALEQARRLVEQENVDFLMGLVNSAVAVPMAQFAGEEEVPFLMVVAGAQAATGPDRSPYVFRTGMANGQQDRPLGWYTATQLGHTQAATFAWDFLVGEERAGGFSETFTAEGGEITLEQKPPLGTTDYGPFISQINPANTEVVYAFFAGPGAISFVQQMREFGFTPDIQVVGSGFLTAGVLEAMGANAVGIVQGAEYTPVLDNPENAAFQELYDVEIGGVAGVYIAEGYLGADVAAQAIAAVGGDMSDKQTFLDALAAVEFDSIAGPFRFGADGQSIRNVYITEVVETGDGGMAQEIVDVIEDVGMDWSP
jgi:branched-chain amino acid transport system substrate-binding protein